MEKWNLAAGIAYALFPVIIFLFYVAYHLQEKGNCLGLGRGREESRSRKGNWRFILGLVAITVLLIFLSEWKFGDYQPGALVAAVVVIILWGVLECGGPRVLIEKLREERHGCEGD